MTYPNFKNDLYYEAHPSDLQLPHFENLINRLNNDIDEDYQIRILGGAVHKEHNWIAWIDFYQDKATKQLSKNKYFLRIQADGKRTLDWQIPNDDWYQASYIYCRWHKNVLVYIYQLDWRCQLVQASIDRINWLKNIGKFSPGISIEDDIVSMLKFPYNGFIYQFQLPDWIMLDPLPEAKAREMGLLEDEDYRT